MQLCGRSELAAVLPEAAAAASAARAAAGAAPAPRAHLPASAPALAEPSATGTALQGAPAGLAAPPWLRHAAGPVPGQGPGSPLGSALPPAGAGSKPPPWLALRANPRIAAVASAQRPAKGPEGDQAPGGVRPQLVNGPDADPVVDPESGRANRVAGDSEGSGSEASDVPDRDLPGLSFGEGGGEAAARPPSGGFGKGTEGTLAGSAATEGVLALPAAMAAQASGAGGAALALTEAERKARRRRCAQPPLQPAGLCQPTYVRYALQGRKNMSLYCCIT